MTANEDWRLIKDQVGSVRLVVDVATGTVLRRLDFDAFGRVLSSTGPLDLVPFGFAGGFWDPDTGLVRFGARDYDPETGRWTAKDPIRFDGGINLYAYAENDPVNRIDPDGRQATEVADALDDLFPWLPGAAALFPGAAAAAGGAVVAVGVVMLCGATFSGDAPLRKTCRRTGGSLYPIDHFPGGEQVCTYLCDDGTTREYVDYSNKGCLQEYPMAH